jgi:uroporphyrinogen-III synthase
LSARSRTLAVSGHSLCLQGSALSVGGDVVGLTPRERALLEALVDAAGAVVSKPQLAKVAWTDTVDDHAIEVAVNRLRRKLGPASAGLETTNRRGYRLAVGAA